MIFRINRCTVDTTAFELRRDNQVVAVQPQVFDLLVLLLENRDRVVTKDEIFERIWKNRIVSDAALSKHTSFYIPIAVRCRSLSLAPTARPTSACTAAARQARPTDSPPRSALGRLVGDSSVDV
ncbi:MAG: hypothetical protein GEV13_31080 [Rhodospirillales bacterium]|nr:hypothetical protein [Rhodospirillales bacterium]